MDTNTCHEPTFTSRRLILTVACWLVISLSFAPAIHVAGALNGDSCGGSPSAVVARLLASTHLNAMPAGADYEIARLIFQPGASISLIGGEWLAVYFVDSGSVTIDVDGEAAITREEFNEGTSTTEPQTVSGTVELLYSDSLSVSPHIPLAITNIQTLPAVLIVMTVVPGQPGGSDTPFSAMAAGVEIHRLASMSASDVLSLPATLTLVRVVYSPGAADTVATINAGPLLLVIEAGSLAYLLTQGEAEVVRAENDTRQPILSGIEMTLSEGDYVAEAEGVISRLSNVSVDRTWFLAALILPSTTSMENYICFDR